MFHRIRDLIAALLALAAIPAVVKGVRGDRLLVWTFNVEGTLDLIAAIVLATAYGASPFMGPAYWIPAFWVPALLVTHYITFVVLQRPKDPSRTTSLLHATAYRLNE